MTRLQEIEMRMTEIRELLLRGEGNLDEIETELGQLEEERSQIQQRQNMLDRLNGGNPMHGNFADHSGQSSNPQRENRMNAASEEYRDAWALAMMGAQMTDEQRNAYDAVNAEYRAFTHTTENTGVLIPETVVAGIWRRVADQHPLWAAVRKFAVRGTLTMKKFVGIKAGDAAWYDEATPTADEQNEFAEIRLDGCELSKAVTVSWKLKKMAISDFIPFIEQEIAERMGAALGQAVYTGKGKPGSEESFKPEPRGIKTALTAQAKTPQVVQYTSGALSDTILRQAIAKIHSSYLPNVKIYCNNTTAWTILAEIKDAQKRPIFLTDSASQGAVGRVFGKNVEVDEAIPDGEILIGSPSAGYWANINENMTMHTEEHVKARTTDYMGYAIVDGDVYDEMAFALIMPPVQEEEGEST